MKHFHLVTLLAAASLAACGGGGGSSVAPPNNVPPTQQPSAKLNAGFATGSGSGSAQARSVHRVAFTSTHQGTTLNGGIYPIANFAIPDNYITPGTFAPIEAVELAYVTGGTVSNPGSVAFSPASGPVLTVEATPSPLPHPAGLPQDAQVIGGQLVGAGTQTGQSTIMVSAIGQTATIFANTYQGTEVTTGGAYNNAPTGLTFTTDTGAQPANGATPDLSIDTTQSVSAFTAPYGIVEVEKSIDQVQTTDFVQSQSSTTLRDPNLCNTDGVQRSFVFNTAAGVLVKLQMLALEGNNVAPGICTWNAIMGAYAVAGQNGFTF